YKQFRKKMNNMYFLFTMVIGYFFGCMNGSQIVGKYKSVNIQEAGTKNAGATNTAVQLGVKFGIVVALIDIVKAVASLTLVAIVCKQLHIIHDVMIVLLFINGLFVLIGHNFPLTMRLKGGKGTASLFGVLLYFDWRLAILGFIVLLVF